MVDRPRDEIRALTSLRGIAALLVVFNHLRETPFLRDGWVLDQYSQFAVQAYLWVDFFFILSGFVIAYVYGERLMGSSSRADHVRFLIKRLGRIYPLHIAVLVAYIVLEGAKLAAVPGGGDAFTNNAPATIPAQVFLLHAWGVSNRLTWVFASWSISAEWMAYLLFPVMAFLAWRIGRPMHMLIGILVCFLALYGAERVALSSGVVWEHMTTWFALLRALPEFMIGVFLFRLTEILPARAKLLIGSNLLLIAAIICVLLTMHFAVPDLLTVIACTGLVLAAALNQGMVSSALGIWPLYALGLISYSIYLTNQLVIRIGQGLMRATWPHELDPLQTGIASALLIVLVIAGSALTYRLIETPGRKYFAGIAARVGGQSKASAAAAATTAAATSTVAEPPARPSEPEVAALQSTAPEPI